MWTMEKFAVNIRYITQNYQIAIYSLCKNAVIRNWFGKHLRANENIFLKISYHHGDTRSWNVIPVFSKPKE